MNITPKALFADLDNTVIETESGRKFPIHSDDWKLIPEILPFIKKYTDNGYRLIIVSNQGGIESGYLTDVTFKNKIEAICKLIEKVNKLKKNSISFFYCKEMEGYNRKPNPGMAYEAALEYELDLSQCVMVGDYKTDEGFAKNAQIPLYIDIMDIKNGLV